MTRFEFLRLRVALDFMNDGHLIEGVSAIQRVLNDAQVDFDLEERVTDVSETPPLALT